MNVQCTITVILLTCFDIHASSRVCMKSTTSFLAHAGYPHTRRAQNPTSRICVFEPEPDIARTRSGRYIKNEHHTKNCPIGSRSLDTEIRENKSYLLERKV